MARRIREHDWAATPLGPVETWPQSLRTAVDLMLASGHAMQLAWGPERIVLYNDAYTPMLGGHHPAALGLPFREAWPDIWVDIEPLVERVFAGETVRFEEMPLVMERHGFREDTWWNFSYSPVRDEAGEVAGLLNVTVDATARVRADRAEMTLRETERRQTFLLRLSDALRPLTDPIMVQTTAMRMLAERLDVMRATYFELEEDQDAFHLTARFERNAVPIPERMRLSDFSKALIEGYTAGRTLTASDTAVRSEFVEQPEAYLAIGVRAWAAVPLVRNGRLVAWIGVHSASPRDWTPTDLQVLEDVAERTWGALEWARAEAALRASEERHAFLLKLSDALRPLDDAAEIERSAVELLGQALGATRTFYATISEDGESWSVGRDYAPGLPSIAGIFPFSEFQQRRLPGWQAGRMSSVADSEAEPTFDDADRAAYAAFGARAAISIPLVRNGRFAAMLAVNQAEPREWTAAELTLARETAERTWATLERIRAEKALRQVEEQQAFLLRLSDVQRPIGDPVEVQRMATRMLGEHLQASRVFYVVVGEDGNTATILGDYTDGVPSRVGRYSLSAFSSYAVGEWRAGRTASSGDVNIDPRYNDAERAAYASVSTRAGFGIPLIKEGRLVALLGVNQSSPRHWSDDDINLASEVAERTWAALERARAEAALRESETERRLLITEMNEGFCILEVIVDEAGNGVDYRFLETNPAFVRQGGFDPAGRLMSEIAPIEPIWPAAYGRVATTGVPERIVDAASSFGRVYDVYAFRIGQPADHRIAVFFSDITARKLAEEALRESEERQAFLLRLSDALRPLADPEEIRLTAAHVLGRHLGANRVAYAENHGDHFMVARNYVDGAAEVVGRQNYVDFGPDILSQLEAGQSRVQPDIQNDGRLSAVQKQGLAAADVGASLNVPLVKKGRLVAFLGVNYPTAHLFEPREIALVEDVAERTWAAVERARAEALSRDSEERFRTLADVSPQLVWSSEDRQPDFYNRRWLDYTGLTLEESCRVEAWHRVVHPDDVALAAQRSEEAAETGKPYEIEYRLRRADGEYRWHIARAYRVPGTTRWVGAATDIHDLKTAQANLIESEERFRTLAESIEDVFYMTDLDRNALLYLSPSYERVWGQPVADLMGDLDGFVDTIHPDDREQFFADKAAQARGEAVTTEYRIVRPDGEVRWVLDRSFPVHSNGVRRSAGVASDITVRKRAEAALCESEERLRGVLDGMGEGFGVIGPDFTVLEYNREALRMDGRPKAEIVGRSHWDAFPGTEHSEVGLLLKRAMADRQPAFLEHRYAWEEGRAFWLELRVYPTADGALAVFWRDVTARKAAEEALTESEARFAQFAASTTDVLWIRDADTMALEYISPAFESVFGVTTGSVNGGIEPGAALVDPADRERVMEHLDAASRGEPQIYEFRIVHGSDGGARWIRDNCFPLLDGTGRVERIGGIARDVTELKLAEQALRESEERLRQFGEASQDVLWIRDADTFQWEYLTPAFETIYGLDHETALSGDNMAGWLELIVPEDRNLAAGELARVRNGEWVTFEYRIRRPSDGEVRWLRNTDFPIQDQAGKVIRIGGIGHDVTEEKETAERMEVLVAELQHRTKNLMGVVRSIGEQTQRSSPDMAAFMSQFRERMGALARVNALLSSLNESHRITFDQLVRSEIDALGPVAKVEGRVSLQGPQDVRLRSSTVQTFSLALHELATNAVKYGALKQEAGAQPGRLAVTWKLTWDGGKPWLHVDWRESGVAMPSEGAPPQGGGAGRQLIERALPYQLGAKTTYVMEADGIHCTIAVPVSEKTAMKERADA